MEQLHIYNTMSRNKQIFIPIEKKYIKMYVCGITVYDYCHIGHARSMIVFDMIKKWLCTIGYKVKYVRNITDVDDKIIKKANENKETIESLTRRFIYAMHKDFNALCIKKPDIEPRVTKFIPQILEMIEALEKNGYAYKAENGDINYSIHKFFQYGKLSRRFLKNINIKKNKKSLLDFVLWKRINSKNSKEIGWDSKYGFGRPGWHIECSAMSYFTLGNQFDIHGGGQDLQFPHHENEIAQNEGITKKVFVNYWIHSGYVKINNKKMSKSLGNSIAIRDLLKEYDEEVIRFFIVKSHYRSSLNYSLDEMNKSRNGIIRLYLSIKKTLPDKNKLDWNEMYAKQFKKAMNNDFNTPEALAVLFKLSRKINIINCSSLSRQLKCLANIIGLLKYNPYIYLKKNKIENKNNSEIIFIKNKINERTIAKKNQDFIKADKIRKLLYSLGIVLEDKLNGLTEWRRL